MKDSFRLKLLIPALSSEICNNAIENVNVLLIELPRT